MAGAPSERFIPLCNSNAYISVFFTFCYITITNYSAFSGSLCDQPTQTTVFVNCLPCKSKVQVLRPFSNVFEVKILRVLHAFLFSSQSQNFVKITFCSSYSFEFSQVVSLPASHS